MSGFRKLNSKGFSLVEMLCAVAIMALVSGIISTIVVVSTRTYKNNVSETSVQQEAQLAANNISNLIKDACAISYYEGDESSDYKSKLIISTNNNKQYVIKHVGTELKYLEGIVADSDKVSTPSVVALSTKDDSDDSETETVTEASEQLLASNITEFKVDTSNFDETRTVIVSLTVYDESTGKEIQMEYTMTSRNEVVDVDEVEFETTTKIIFLDDPVCLVPTDNEEDYYTIPISIIGDYDGGLTAEGEGLAIRSVTSNGIEVRIPTSTSGYKDSYNLTVSLNKDGNTISNTTQVKCRYVNKIVVKSVSNVKEASGGAKEGAGAVYTFTAYVYGGNLSKFVGYDWDLEYKNAKAVYWSYELHVDGKDYTFKVDQETGNAIYSNQSEIEKYIKIVEINGDAESPTNPTLVIKLVQNMYSDFRLKVIATSKHGCGVNKATSAYNEKITGNDTVEATRGSAADDYEITMEPNEERTITLDSLVGEIPTKESSKVDINGYTSKDTTAEYDDKKVTIHLGKDEKGTDYKFTVELSSKGEKVSTITVNVRRVDSIKLEEANTNNNSSKTHTYNVMFNGITNENKEKIYNLINDVDSIDVETIVNDLSFELSYVIKNRSSNVSISNSDKAKTVIIKPDIEYVNENNVTTSMHSNNTSGNLHVTCDDYEITITPAKVRIVAGSNSKNELVQSPTIKVTLKKNTNLGVDNNKMFVIKAVALHPNGVYGGNNYNITGKPYTDDEVSGINYVKGIATDKFLTVEPEDDDPYNVIVEPEETVILPFYINTQYSGNFNIQLWDKYNDNTGAKIVSIKVEDGNENYLGIDTATDISWSCHLNEQYRSEYGEQIKCSITIEVGDETGLKSKGSFRLVIFPYGYSDEGSVNQNEFNVWFNIRKVNDVNLSVLEDNGKLYDSSTYENIITLEASPTGYGSDGVQYYPIGLFDHNIEYYDSQGKPMGTTYNSKYKSPYTMNWTYYDDENKTTYTIKQLEDLGIITILKPSTTPKGYVLSSDGKYIYPDCFDADAGTTKNPNSISHGAVLSFVVNEGHTLNGTIRATSLHSKGTNKSNKSYSGNNGVYGELNIINGKIIKVDTIYVDPDTCYVTPNSDVTITFYVASDLISEVSAELGEYVWNSGTEITSCSVNDNLQSSNYLKISNTNGISKCSIKVHIGNNEEGNTIKLTAHNRNDWNITYTATVNLIKDTTGGSSNSGDTSGGDDSSGSTNSNEPFSIEDKYLNIEVDSNKKEVTIPFTVSTDLVSQINKPDLTNWSWDMQSVIVNGNSIYNFYTDNITNTDGTVQCSVTIEIKDSYVKENNVTITLHKRGDWNTTYSFTVNIKVK
jgi:prepilin-type N-terminal cleavage/methylation domain-containing protein